MHVADGYGLVLGTQLRLRAVQCPGTEESDSRRAGWLLPHLLGFLCTEGCYDVCPCYPCSVGRRMKAGSWE